MSGLPPIPVEPLSEEGTLRIEREIKKWQGHLEDVFGKFRQERLPTGRVLLVSDNEVPHVCYMSDESSDARLCVDDYVPELGDPKLDQSRPSDNQ